MYRLTYRAQHPGADDLATGMVMADRALGRALAGLASHAILLDHEHYVTMGSSQVHIDFLADDDRAAYRAAAAALGQTRLPLLDERLERRVPTGR